MKENVASAAGLELDPDAREKAGTHILRVINRLNVWDRFAFLRQISSDVALSENDSTVDFDTDVYIPLALHLVNLDGDIRHTLTRIDYESLGQRGIAEGNVSRPDSYAILNPYSDRKYYIWPYVDAQTATEYKIRQVYYKRLSRPSSDTDLLQAPEEFAALVEIGAQFRFARFMRPNHTALWGSLQREFITMMMEMTTADERDRPEQWQWSYGPANKELRGEPTFLEAFWRD